jgi:hypothetical protein
MEQIEKSFITLGEAFQKHPFDFYKENDITCFLYNELKQGFPNRVPVKLENGIERFNAFDDSHRMFCERVHTEAFCTSSDGKENRTDIVVLEDRQQVIYPKSQSMMGKIEPPFLAGIEIKLAYGTRSSRFSGISSGKGVTTDIVKLSFLSEVFSYSYVVIVDFFEKRNLSMINQQVKFFRKVGFFYAGLDRYELILP